MKAGLRKKILEERNKLTDSEIKERSLVVRDKLFSSDGYKKAEKILFYVSFGSEVDTHEMIKESLGNKIVCVPVVIGDKIIASMIKDFKELDTKNKYKISEPSNINKIDPKEIDLVIVPGVAFDRLGHRIGYGKGYYDSFLSNLNAKKLALAFELQIVDEIPKEWHDIAVDEVISEI